MIRDYRWWAANALVVIVVLCGVKAGSWWMAVATSSAYIVGVIDERRRHVSYRWRPAKRRSQQRAAEVEVGWMQRPGGEF